MTWPVSLLAVDAAVVDLLATRATVELALSFTAVGAYFDWLGLDGLEWLALLAGLCVLGGFGHALFSYLNVISIIALNESI